MYELILKILSFPFMKKKKNLVHILEREMHTVKAKNLYNLVINPCSQIWWLKVRKYCGPFQCWCYWLKIFCLFNTRTKKIHLIPPIYKAIEPLKLPVHVFYYRTSLSSPLAILKGTFLYIVPIPVYPYLFLFVQILVGLKIFFIKIKIIS